MLSDFSITCATEVISVGTDRELAFRSVSLIRSLLERVAAECDLRLCSTGFNSSECEAGELSSLLADTVNRLAAEGGGGKFRRIILLYLGGGFYDEALAGLLERCILPASRPATFRVLAFSDNGEMREALNSTALPSCYAAALEDACNVGVLGELAEIIFHGAA